MMSMALQPKDRAITCIAGQSSVALEVRGHVVSDIAGQGQ